MAILNRFSVTGQHLYSKKYRTVVHLDIYLCRFFLIVMKAGNCFDLVLYDHKITLYGFAMLYQSVHRSRTNVGVVR